MRFEPSQNNLPANQTIEDLADPDIESTSCDNPHMQWQQPKHR
jgi:hypothetical protein